MRLTRPRFPPPARTVAARSNAPASPRSIKKICPSCGRSSGASTCTSAVASPVAAASSAKDQTFFEHRGFDVDSIQDALAEAQQGGRVRGASTISQQVSKNLFLWPGRSVTRKGLEAYVTVFVELFWPKRRILEVYLNVAEFGDGIYGIAAASDHFFDTVPARIDADQAALLAAVLPNPKRLKVDEPSVYVRERQAWIRTQMIQLGGTELLSATEP